MGVKKGETEAGYGIRRPGWESLANAIIQQAVYDYRQVMNTLKKHPGDKMASGTIKEVERFFRSDWFVVLSNIDGKRFLKMLRGEWNAAGSDIRNEREAGAGEVRS